MHTHVVITQWLQKLKKITYEAVSFIIYFYTGKETYSVTQFFLLTSFFQVDERNL